MAEHRITDTMSVSPVPPAAPTTPAIVDALPARAPSHNMALPRAIPPRARAAEAQQPTVRIGSIEVRVMPPPSPPPPTPAARASAAKPSPAPSISRGFTSPFGLRQG
jgi:hypothetical protein